ncbi:hypothetical protein K457DRAFT_826999 [Linnemannia elongata AG-77]|uniref:Uncharacterized protein n=1 Tax=Linnemannia elongata AG-77 TaxID=1314771 RepID=A0A197JJ87_9FUNG|nr:hypothetical protein K457DRAFT_826999 [Linnemannia elongata AG-77]
MLPHSVRNSMKTDKQRVGIASKAFASTSPCGVGLCPPSSLSDLLPYHTTSLSLVLAIHFSSTFHHFAVSSALLPYSLSPSHQSLTQTTSASSMLVVVNYISPLLIPSFLLHSSLTSCPSSYSSFSFFFCMCVYLFLRLGRLTFVPFGC